MPLTNQGQLWHSQFTWELSGYYVGSDFSLAENFIFCIVRLVIEGKAGKEITEPFRLEFLLTFSANNYESRAIRLRR